MAAVSLRGSVPARTGVTLRAGCSPCTRSIAALPPCTRSIAALAWCVLGASRPARTGPSVESSSGSRTPSLRVAAVSALALVGRQAVTAAEGDRSVRAPVTDHLDALHTGIAAGVARS